MIPGETKEETETPSEEEQHESFVEYLRNPKNFQGSWDVGKKEKVEKNFREWRCWGE